MQGELAGKALNELHGIAATQHGHMIIADGKNKRLLVLDATNGELINEQGLQQCDHATRPHLINNDKELVLWYGYQNKECIAHYSIQ